MRSLFLRFVLWLYKSHHLTLAERNLFTSEMLDSLNALPLRDIITSSDEGILINGLPPDIEQVRKLRGSAIAALSNQALNYIAEQVVWVAVQNGIHKGDAPEKLYFYRAAIWFSQQMKAHLEILAGTQESPL